jgi:ATP-dependent Clp protease ATP-binding subunit ClpA
MSYRDLIGVRALATEWNGEVQAKQLIDQFKYGRRESEWDALEYDRLADAEEQLGRRVMGQPHAVAAVADVLRRAKLGLSGAQHSSRGKPRGVLFFAGPTGVGKTELAKAVAELVFNTEEALLRFDMSEYAHSHADQRLLGAPPGYVGYEEGGQLTQQLLANPFRVILFDEIEKTHPSILDKFLQILEDGRLTDGRGQTVYFSESIIIFTSNAGIYQLDQHTGRPLIDPATGNAVLNVDPKLHTDYDVVRTRVQDGVRAYFKHYLGRPELLNRIGQNIIVFNFVRAETMRLILEKKVMRSICAQVKQAHGVTIEFDPAVAEEMLKILGEDVSQGGRGVGNLAEPALLNPLARQMEGRTLKVSALIPPRPGETMQYDLDCELI